MKFQRFINENKPMTYTAMWISPSGKVLTFDTENHIGMVIANPSAFGYTKEKIEALYTKYNEPMGVEGKAREEIIVDLVKKGWVRVRRYRNYWSVTVPSVSKKVKDTLYDWANKILSGINGLIERDKFMPVKIVTMTTAFGKEFTVDQIAKDALYEQNEHFDIENRLVLVENVYKF